MPRATGGISTRTAVMGLFGMMNWLYTWYNPRVDPDAETLAREISDIFLRGVRAEKADGWKPAREPDRRPHGEIGRPSPQGKRRQAQIRFAARKGPNAFMIALSAIRCQELSQWVARPSLSSTRGEATCPLPCRVGVAVIRLNDPPANTYSYEMNRQLDDAILAGAHGQRCLRDCADRRGRKVLLRGREHPDADRGRSHIQVLLLPARQ